MQRSGKHFTCLFSVVNYAIVFQDIMLNVTFMMIIIIKNSMLLHNKCLIMSMIVVIRTIISGLLRTNISRIHVIMEITLLPYLGVLHNASLGEILHVQLA